MTLSPMQLGRQTRPGLTELGIHPHHNRPGEHRLPCPKCDRGKSDTALAVRVEPDGTAVWLCHRCGWRGGSTGETRAAEFRPKPRPAPDRDQLAAARRFWRSCVPIEPGCPVARYLEARHCPLPPDGLRWHPEARHPSGHVGPAMVARVTDAATAEPMTLHRTWVQENGTKAPIDRPRLLWPGLPKAGGVVRLWPDDEVTLGLCVAEGIETALTAALAFGLAWAAIDKSNMAALPVLGGIEALTIVADNDPDGGGLRAAEACGARWAAAGCEVRIWIAPAAGADFNDHAAGAAA